MWYIQLYEILNAREKGKRHVVSKEGKDMRNIEVEGDWQKSAI